MEEEIRKILKMFRYGCLGFVALTLLYIVFMVFWFIFR